MFRCPPHLLMFVVLLAWGLCVPLKAQAQDKGLLQSTLSVAVRNDYERLLSGAELTLTDGAVPLTGTFADGAYTFPPVAAGNYNLTIANTFFQGETMPIELAATTESAEIVLSLDEAQFPNELLDNYRDFDTDLNGEIGEPEFTAAFTGAADAYLTYRDRCECALTPRNIAALFDRPFLGVSPAKSYGEGSFPASTVDFGEVVENASHSKNIILSNDGGGRLTGSVTFEAHGDVSITPTPESYDLGAGNSRTITLELAPQEPGSFSGLLQFTGNYDGLAVPLSVAGTVIVDGGEGEGEGEGEPGGCNLDGDSDAQAATADPAMIGAALLLLLFPRRLYRRRP